MSKKILFQSLLKFRDQIKDGTAKVQDIITDYFNQTGKSVTDEERAIILNEFAKDAPDNITTMPTSGAKSETPFTDQVRKENPDVEITGRETFGELMEKLGPTKRTFKGVEVKDPTFDLTMPYDNDAEKLAEIKMSNEAYDMEKARKEGGIGSLFPKGKRGEMFDIDNSKREEVAEFVRNMRKEGIANPDIKGVFKEFGTDIEGGKRAATTLARAADMKADTKVKQELLSELDEMKMDKGPRFFQEEYMGFDDFRSAEDAKKIEVNNAIVDDLEAMGVEDDTVMFIMGRAREINKKPFYTSGEDFVDIIKEELEFQGIDYDVEFYKNYFRELTGLMRKPEPRFMYGGVV